MSWLLVNSGGEGVRGMGGDASFPFALPPTRGRVKKRIKQEERREKRRGQKVLMRRAVSKYFFAHFLITYCPCSRILIIPYERMNKRISEHTDSYFRTLDIGN